MKNEPKCFAEDGTYSTSYPTDADGGHKSIHAYSTQAEERKSLFLRHARAYLKAIGEELRAYGFTEQDISVNESGIATSGDAHATYKQPWLDRWIYLSVGTTCITQPLARPAEIGQPLNTMAAMTTRRDGVMILGRWHAEPERLGHGEQMGPNTYFDPNLNSREVAAAVVRLARIQPLRLPEREPLQASLFDIAA